MAKKTISLPELAIGDINGAISTSGLTVAGKITEISVSTSWVALPATPLVDRNAISIQNQGAVEVKLGYTGSGGYIGVKMAADSERFYNITDSIVIYARTLSGSTTLVVEELS